MPARRKYLVPKGLKPVRRTLATGETRLYWYHRATGQRLEHDPATAEGMLEVARLDGLAEPNPRAQPSALSGGALGPLSGNRRGVASPQAAHRSDYQAVRDWIGDAAQKVSWWDVTTHSGLACGTRRQARAGASGTTSCRFCGCCSSGARLRAAEGARTTPRHGQAGAAQADRTPARSTAPGRKPRSAPSWPPRPSAAAVVPFALGLFAGMRQGDALIVTWAAYDGAPHRLDRRKERRGCHRRPSPGSSSEILDEAKERRDAPADRRDDGRYAWTASGFRASFFKLVRKLTEAGHLQPGCTFHGLRHTIASRRPRGRREQSRVAAAIGDKSRHGGNLRPRRRPQRRADVDSGGHQKRFANIDWKTEGKTGPIRGEIGLKTAKPL
jgi:hypothetical protein